MAPIAGPSAGERRTGLLARLLQKPHEIMRQKRVMSARFRDVRDGDPVAIMKHNELRSIAHNTRVAERVVRQAA
jgi:hypothetical protein